MSLIILFIICLFGIYLALHHYSEKPKLQYDTISLYDDVNSYNYVSNIPYFRKDRYLTTNKIWAGKNGPPAPTGPAYGNTYRAGMWLLPDTQTNYRNILNIPDHYAEYPKLGIQDPRYIYQYLPIKN